MRKIMKLAATFALGVAVIGLHSCNAKTASGGSMPATVKPADAEQLSDAADEMKTFVSQLYADFVVKLKDDKSGSSSKYAFEKYASASLRKTLDEVEAWNEANQDMLVLGWDSDPWIMAQDFMKPEVKVVKANALTMESGKVDVSITDMGDVAYSTLFVVKENGQWKVADFDATNGVGRKSFATSLKEELEQVKQEKK